MPDMSVENSAHEKHISFLELLLKFLLKSEIDALYPSRIR